MPKTTTRTAAAAIALLGLLASLLAVTATPSSAAPATVPSSSAAKGCTGVQWLSKCANLGYGLPRGCGKAWCGSIGALGKRKLYYRTDPAANNRGGYKNKTRWKVSSGKPKGKQCKWGKSRGKKAAYVASRWGKTTSNLEAAAVDVAIVHFLCGKQKQWRIKGKATKKRLNQASGIKKKRVKKKARKMTKAAKKQHGPYTLSVKAPATNGLGDSANITATLTTAKGNGAAGRKAVLHLPEGGTLNGTTNSNGQVTWSVQTTKAGTRNYQVTAKVEQHRLAMKKPKKKRSSRLVMAGYRHTVAEQFAISVKVQPTGVGVAASATLPNTLRASFTYSGSAGNEPKKVIRRLRGGPSETTPTCDSQIRGTWDYIYSGDFNFSSFTHSSTFTYAGNYVWEIVIEGDEYNHPVRWCSEVVELRKATPTVQFQSGSPSSVMVQWSGHVYPHDGDLSFTLYGPFSTGSSAECAGPVERSQTMSGVVDSAGGGHTWHPQFPPPTGGGPRYWRVEATINGNRANNAVTACGQPFSN